MYQLFVYFQPDLDPGALQSAMDKCTKFIDSKKGSIVKEEKVRKVSLAYPIQKKEFAYAWMSEMKLPSKAISDFENFLVHDTNVMRHILARATTAKKIAATYKRQSRLDKRAKRNEANKPTPPQKATEAQAKDVATDIKDKELKVEEKKQTKKPKVKMSEIDKKLDELLEGKL